MPRTQRSPGGAEVPGRPVLLRVLASGLSRARVKLRHRGALLIVGLPALSGYHGESTAPGFGWPAGAGWIV